MEIAWTTARQRGSARAGGEVVTFEAPGAMPRLARVICSRAGEHRGPARHRGRRTPRRRLEQALRERDRSLALLDAHPRQRAGRIRGAGPRLRYVRSARPSPNSTACRSSTASNCRRARCSPTCPAWALLLEGHRCGLRQAARDIEADYFAPKPCSPAQLLLSSLLRVAAGEVTLSAAVFRGRDRAAARHFGRRSRRPRPRTPDPAQCSRTTCGT